MNRYFPKLRLNQQNDIFKIAFFRLNSYLAKNISRSYFYLPSVEILSTEGIGTKCFKHEKNNRGQVIVFEVNR